MSNLRKRRLYICDLVTPFVVHRQNWTELIWIYILYLIVK